MKNSFILHNDSLSILDDMTNEQAGILLKSLYHYQKTGEKLECDFAMKMALSPFYNQFDRDAEKYRKTCEARVKAGSRGGKQKVANLANASKCKQKVANLADNDNDSDNVKDNKKENIKEKRFRKPELSEIKSYISENELNVKEQTFFDYYESNGWKVGKNPMQDWKACVRTWHQKNRKPAFTHYTVPEVNVKSVEDIY